MMESVSRNFSVVARVVAIVALAAAAFFSIRLAIADHQFRLRTPASVARALALLPGNTAYLALRALQLDYDNQDAGPLLERAARLNPLASEPRIRLGLAAETRGDFVAAERWLLDAARVDHQFEPRWTLANFYFRQNRQNDFWVSIRQALAVSYGDRRLAFDLVWRVSQDSVEILARAIPPEHEVMRAYLNYVMEQHREAAGSAALPLAAMRDPADMPALEAACDALIAGGKTAEAQALWRALGHAPAGLLTNGGFTEAPRGHGFDWRPIESAGVHHASLAAPPGHRVSLSGKQAETCDLVVQYVALTPGRRYILRWDARTVNLMSPSGIEWAVGNTAAAVESAEAWSSGSAAFTAPAGLLHVTLRYRRPPGQARAEGAVEIRNVALTEQTP
jgi:tetratricopeptide (TPR) repeat protein